MSGESKAQDRSGDHPDQNKSPDKDKGKVKTEEKWSGIKAAVLLLLLTILFPLTAMLVGCNLFLIREGILWMDEESYQEYMTRYAQTTINGFLDGSKDGYGNSLRIYADPPKEEGAGSDQITEQMAKTVARFVITQYMDDNYKAIDTFFTDNGLKYALYHYAGRRLFGTLPASEEKYAWKCRGMLYDGKYYQEAYYVKLGAGDYPELVALKSTKSFRLKSFLAENQKAVVGSGAICVILCLILFCSYLRLAVLRGRHSIPLLSRLQAELLLLAALGTLALLARMLWDRIRMDWAQPKEIAGIGLAFSFLLLVTLAHFISRMQVKHWYRNTLCYQAILLLKKTIAAWKTAIGNLSMTWKLFGILLGISAVELVVMLLLWKLGNQFIVLMILWCLEKAILLPVILNYGVAITKLQKAASEIAAGNLQYQVELKSMPQILQSFGENVNSVSDSISMAVEERLKSERMKTELITNVSHDIKTPLTSIINFSDLITREKTDNPKITEYAELLNKQSSRLKKLIEDLMEASKASTGNLEVHPELCDVKILLEQCVGEFEPRLEERELELVVRHPEASMNIMADTRMIWRVFENLMNNICKYAQKDTRVYLSSECDREKVRITFKNVSKYKLDIQPEELMERFVRGDLSRHTEGSGLGLSIVKSLMELQGGTLTLATDGDLFKAILTFPAVKTEEKSPEGGAEKENSH